MCMMLLLLLLMMMVMMMMMVVVVVQAERQKSDAVSQCQKIAAERDEAVQGNKFLQSKLREAEIALKELGQNVRNSQHVVEFPCLFRLFYCKCSVECVSAIIFRSTREST